MKNKKILDDLIGEFNFILDLIPSKSLPEGKRILIIRLWSMGESILTLPLISQLAKKGYKVDVLCSKFNKDIFLGQKFINKSKIISLNPLKDLRKILSLRNKYDIVIDTEPFVNISLWLAKFINGYSIGFNTCSRKDKWDANIIYNDKQHVVLTFLDLMKPIGKYFVPKNLIKLKYGLGSENKVKRLLKGIGNKKKIIIHGGVGSTNKNRCWSPINFSKVMKRLDRKDVCFILTGYSNSEIENDKLILKNSELNHAKAIITNGKLKNKDLFCLISKSDLVISNDTGPMHVGASQRTPTIGLFGPNTPVRFSPYGSKNHSIYKSEGRPLINVHLKEFKEDGGLRINRINPVEIVRLAKKILWVK